MDKNTDLHHQFMSRAIALARIGVKKNAGGPFGAVIVKDGEIIAEGHNEVLINNDPSAHAEITAIRRACAALGDFQLTGCILYTSCEPCPMCLGAIYWARPDKVYFACTKKDAATAGFDDDFIYKELDLPMDQRSIYMEHVAHDQSKTPFEDWDKKEDKIPY